ncbi:MAG: HD-GYP domain-containing protein [Phycisphaerales bacterium]
MLLCAIRDILPGAVTGASVMHPEAPDVELLKPGVTISEALLKRLRGLGVSQVWIEHDLTGDLESSAARQIVAARSEIYERLKADVNAMAKRTITATTLHEYRQSVMDFILNIAAGGPYASLADHMFTSRRDLFSHGTNVAYLALMVGLELREYIVRERPRIEPEQARDLTTLGLGAMWHDIGKARLEGPGAERHEIIDGGIEDGDADAESSLAEYERHTILGYRMLRDCRAPASVTQIVLNHHQRFDGTGWPDMAAVTGRANAPPQVGQQIHILVRIVSVANVLDNLLIGADGAGRPPIMALCEFAGPNFDGWFDPIVRLTALRRIPPFPVGSAVELDDGSTAAVTAPNMAEPCRPSVRLLEESVSGVRGQVIDLAVHPERSIAKYTGVPVARFHYILSDIVKRLKAA